MKRLKTTLAAALFAGSAFTAAQGAVLENGRLFYYARIERAIEHHDHLMQGQLPPWMR